MPFFYDNPQPTDQLSISQGNILTNFNILGVIAGNTNPSSASLNAVSGFNWINLAQQGSNPPPGSAFPAGNIGLYAAKNGATSQYELYINKTNQATVTQIPATASILSINSNPGANSAGFSYLPSGILLQWGQSTVLTAAGGNQTITFNIPFPTACIQVLLSNYSTGLGGGVVWATYSYNINTTDFTFQYGVNPAGTAYVNFLAIGY